MEREESTEGLVKPENSGIEGGGLEGPAMVLNGTKPGEGIGVQNKPELLSDNLEDAADLAAERDLLLGGVGLSDVSPHCLLAEDCDATSENLKEPIEPASDLGPREEKKDPA